MNITLSAVPPFHLAEGETLLVETGSPAVYQQLLEGVQDKNELVHVSDDDFASVDLEKSLAFYGDPMLNIDLDRLFIGKIIHLLASQANEETQVGLIDANQQLITKVLTSSFMMDLPLTVNSETNFSDIFKHAEIQFSRDLIGSGYGIIEAILKCHQELNINKIICLTNVSHYLNVNQLNELVSVTQDLQLKLFLIEFSEVNHQDTYANLCYHYIDADFVEWHRE